MWIYTSSQHIDNLGTLSSGIVTSWSGWHSGQRWLGLWSQLAALLVWRCTCSFASLAYLLIYWSAILARKTSGCGALTNHSQVSLYRNLCRFMPRKLIPPLLLCSNIRMRFIKQVLHFRQRGAWKPFVGCCGHIQGQARVGLFQLYPTSLPCHSSRHVEYLPEISCCFQFWHSAIISTKYASVAFSKVIKACFAHSRGWLSEN